MTYLHKYIPAVVYFFTPVTTQSYMSNKQCNIRHAVQHNPNGKVIFNPS